MKPNSYTGRDAFRGLVLMIFNFCLLMGISGEPDSGHRYAVLGIRICLSLWFLRGFFISLRWFLGKI